MKVRKCIIGVAVAALSAVGVVSVVPAAGAHTGDLTVAAVCNVETGEYDLTATLRAASTSLTGTTRWRVGSERFEGTPRNADGMDRGPITTSGSQTVTLGVFSLPGDTTGYGPWIYAHTTWSDSYKVGSDGQLTQKLKGDCVKPTPPAQPDDLVEYTEWADGIWQCGDTEVTQTREKSVTTYTWDEDAWEWIAGEPVVTVEEQTRTLTDDERLDWQTADPEAPCFNRPEQPEPVLGSEERPESVDCTIPLDGTGKLVYEGRTSTAWPVWDEASGEYVYGEPEWTEWGTVRVELIEHDIRCVETIEPKPELPEEPDVNETVALATTGGPNLWLGGALAALVTAGGAALIARGRRA